MSQGGVDDQTVVMYAVGAISRLPLFGQGCFGEGRPLWQSCSQVQSPLATYSCCVIFVFGMQSDPSLEFWLGDGFTKLHERWCELVDLRCSLIYFVTSVVASGLGG